MNPLIDTHCHLTWHSFRGKVDSVIERARKEDLIAIVDLGTDVESSHLACRHSEMYPEVYFGAGVHPNDAGQAKNKDLAEIETLAQHLKCVAIGEIGLDFYREHASPSLQRQWLREQLKMAIRLQKPVVLHDRNASKELLRILDEESYNGLSGAGGVFHCFAGDVAMAQEVIERGFYISLTGNVTFPKSNRIEVAKAIPLDRLLLETDSPFMAPVPYRGKQNEPAFLPYIVAFLANLRGISIDHLACKTTENAIRLFKFTI